MARPEMRRSPRFSGKVAVQLGGATGITRDFSTSGIYFYIDRVLSIGEQIDFSLALNSLGAGKAVSVHCTGNVLRVEPQDERFGIAVELTAHTFGDFGIVPV